MACALAAGVLSACASDQTGAPAAARVTHAASIASTQTASAPPDTAGYSSTSDGGGLSVPAETAGDLDASDVPAPPDLGPGWTQYVDPGEAEDGYVGNGSWVRARGVEEVVQAVVPLGCTGLTTLPRLPVPKHALEATYRGPGGAPAVALVLEYRREAQARAFVTLLGDAGRSCPAPAQPVRRTDPMVAVVTQVRADDRMVLDRRREHGVGASEWLWSEAVVRRGGRVGLLTVASPHGGDTPDLAGLARSVRASISR